MDIKTTEEVKILDCEDHIHPATGSYTGQLQKPETLKVNNIAILSCKGITVLVKVTNINNDIITGIVNTFENFDKQDLDGVSEGDLVQFERRKVIDWL